MMDREYRVTGITDRETEEVFRFLLPASLGKGMAEGEFLLGAYDAEYAPAGVLLYEFNGFGYELLYLGVHPEHRRRGVATLLLDTFLESLYAMDRALPVRILFVPDEETEAFSEFIRSRSDFFFTETVPQYQLTKADRESSPAYKRLLRGSSEAKRYADLPAGVRKGFVNEQHKSGLWFLQAPEEEDFDPELSLCELEDGHIAAAALFRKISEKERELSYLYVRNDAPVLLTEVLTAAMQALEKHCPDADLYLQAVNAHARELLKKIFPESRPLPAGIECAVWDFSL